jgi:thioredoxin
MSNEISNRKDFDEVTKSNDWVLVDIFATWCGPCKSLAPIFEEIANEREGSLFATKVDVDKVTELAVDFNVRGVPTLALVHDGKLVDQLVGAQPKSNIDQWLDANQLDGSNNRSN